MTLSKRPSLQSSHAQTAHHGLKRVPETQPLRDLPALTSSLPSAVLQSHLPPYYSSNSQVHFHLRTFVLTDPLPDMLCPGLFLLVFKPHVASQLSQW